MARYTELFAEWLQDGGELPAVFDQIEGFADLFVGHFCDSEIGVETPELFGVKLEARANLVVPEYAEHITALENARAKLIAGPTYTDTDEDIIAQRKRTDEHGERKNNVKYTAADRETRDYELPINGNVSNITPSNISQTDGYTDNTDTTDEAVTDTSTEAAHTDKRTHTHTGLTVGESLQTVEHFEGEVVNLKRRCLDEFNDLFMLIYL